MSTLKTKAVQIGQSLTATNNFTLYQPSTPDGTVRLGVGNAGSVTDTVTLTSGGRVAIGTSTPSSEGRITIGSGTVTDNNGIILNRGNAGAASSTQVGIFNEWNGIGSGESLTLRSPNGYKFQNNTGSSEWMRIKSNGNVVKYATFGQGVASQWLNGSKSYGTTSGVWVPIFFSDHSHALTYNILVMHPGGPNNGAGSISGFSAITYGGGNGPSNTRSGFLGDGYITSINARYNNAGYQIEIFLTGSFGGSAPVIYWQVIGSSLSEFGAL